MCGADVAICCIMYMSELFRNVVYFDFYLLHPALADASRSFKLVDRVRVFRNSSSSFVLDLFILRGLGDASVPAVHSCGVVARLRRVDAHGKAARVANATAGQHSGSGFLSSDGPVSQLRAGL